MLLALWFVSYLEQPSRTPCPQYVPAERGQHPFQACCSQPKVQLAQQEVYRQGAGTADPSAQTGHWLNISSGFETYEKHTTTRL